MASNLSMLVHCVLCGACTCVPDDETLVSYIDDSSPYQPINEDDVLWLRSFRLIGKLQPGPRTPRLEDDGKHTEDQSPTSFLTGPVRARGSKFEVVRGTADGIQFGGGITVSGAGPEEILSVKREKFLDFVADKERARELIPVHTACYDDIFSRVVDHVKRKENFRATASSGSWNIDNVHACLKNVKLATVNFRCSFSVDPLVRGIKPEEVFQAERLLWARKRRDYLCDPGSSDWTNNYKIQWPQPSESNVLGNDFMSGSHWRRAGGFSMNIDSNPFELLPVDVILAIADMLSIREIFFLSAASPATSVKLNDSEFWKRRIPKDMPWLWDCCLMSVADQRSWRRIYFDRWDKCIYESQRRMLGLVNRKRIWNLCLPIAKSYICRIRAKESGCVPWRRGSRGMAAVPAGS